MKISTIVNELDLKDSTSTAGKIVRVTEPKMVKDNFADSGEREQQTLIIADPEDTKFTVGYFYKKGPPWFTREHEGEIFEVEKAVVASEYQGNKYLDKGKIISPKLEEEESKESKSKKGPAKPRKLQEDYVTLACGFAALWHSIIVKHELSAEAIDAIAKRVDTIIIQDRGINLDRIRMVGAARATALMAELLPKETPPPQEPEPTKESPPTDEPDEILRKAGFDTPTISEQMLVTIREWYEIASSRGLTDEKMATILKEFQVKSLKELSPHQAETMLKYLKEWREPSAGK